MEAYEAIPVDGEPLFFGTEEYGAEHPDDPKTAKDVYAVAADALDSINYKIGLGRGDDYKIGQGVFMKCS